jgi:hypothetical protein
MTESEALDRIENMFGLSHFEELPAVEFIDATTVRLTGCLTESEHFADVVETYDLSSPDTVEQVSVVYPLCTVVGAAA